MPVIDARDAILLSALAFGLCLPFHGLFFFVALFVLAIWAASQEEWSGQSGDDNGRCAPGRQCCAGVAVSRATEHR